MATDDLTKPLGLASPRNPRKFFGAWKIAAGSAAIALAIAAIWFLLIQDPTVDGTNVVASLDNISSPTTKPSGISNVTPANRVTPNTEINGSNGLTEILPDGAISEIGADAVTIRNPNDPSPLQLAAAPAENLLESGPHGPLPRIGPDGTRPIDSYARPTDPQKSSNPIQIAIIVGGIGITEAGTNEAISGLPGAVTLAFAPYGEDLLQTLARARTAGHEILLQIPLEPYGYPNNNPGPHTLTVDASAEENMNRLHWLMSRITTYVGVMNHLGARFTGEESALEPVISEIGNRGLLYLDDGTSSTSRASRIAEGRTPFARADLVLDAVTEGKAIDSRLAEVEAIARQRGYAIATASAFSVTIRRIAEFTKSATERGIEIVPISVVVDRARQ